MYAWITSLPALTGTVENGTTKSVGHQQAREHLEDTGPEMV